MQVAVDSDYRNAARQIKENEPELRAGSHDWWDRIRQIINENGKITHSQVKTYQGDDVVVITGR